MADDSRKQAEIPSNGTDAAADDSTGPRRYSRNDFPKSQASKMWDAFGNPENPANEMPGGTYNSAGGKPREVTWKDAFSWKWTDFRTFYKTPCARDSLLVGGGCGAVLGGVTTIIGGWRSISKATNVAALGFALISSGHYAWCDSNRKEEARGMAMAVIGMKQLQEKKRRQEEEEAAKVADAARLAEEERQKRKSAWRFW